VLIDSHCHLDMLDLAEFGGDLASALGAARAAGVTHFLCVAVDLERWPAMVERVALFDDVSVSVGVHPGHQEAPLPSIDLLVDMANDDRVVAIGETGLDYHYGAAHAKRQRDSFRIHARAARRAGKPLIVHTRSARDDTLQILEEEGAAEVGGVLHCFTEDQAMAEQAMELGFLISLSGIVTFRNAATLREVALSIPSHRLLLETDSPYLSPVPYRGKPNHPARLLQVAEFVANLRGETLEALGKYTSDNFFRLFGRRPRVETTERHP